MGREGMYISSLVIKKKNRKRKILLGKKYFLYSHYEY